MFPKYAAQFAALLCVGLVLSASAAPVTTKNEKTGEVVIVDKATGERVILKNNILTYGGKGLNWKTGVSRSEYESQNNMILYGYNIYVSTRNRVIKYSKFGKILWQKEADDGLLLKVFPVSKILHTRQCSDGATISCGDVDYNIDNGKQIYLSGEAIAEEQGMLLVYVSPYDSYSWPYSMNLKDGNDLAKVLLTTTSYILELNKGKEIKKEFLTPSRKNCNGFRPSIEEIGYKEYFYDGTEEGAEKLQVIGKYFEDTVRGEYIYAHRQDGCGKFTYRFHWTDPKNLGPVILQGWR